MSTNLFVTPMASIGQAQDVQEAVAGYWRAVGAQVELLSTDPTEIANNTRVRKYSNHVQMWANASAMFTGFTGLFLTWGGRGNGFEDFDVDRYVLEAVSTFDEKKQDEAWRKAARSIRQARRGPALLAPCRGRYQPAGGVRVHVPWQRYRDVDARVHGEGREIISFHATMCVHPAHGGVDHCPSIAAQPGVHTVLEWYGTARF